MVGLLQVEEGTPLVKYSGPAPSSGVHRYVTWAFKQHGPIVGKVLSLLLFSFILFFLTDVGRFG